MQRIIYLIFVFITLVGCQQLKTKEKNLDIVINSAQSYKYDLTKCVYTVFFRDRPDTEITFHLSPEEKTKIIDKYYKLSIDDINGVDKELGTTVIYDNCMIMPKPYTILHIQSKLASQDIQIDEACNDYSSSSLKKGKSVSLFLNFIQTVLRAKPEIENAPISNVMYR